MLEYRLGYILGIGVGAGVIYPTINLDDVNSENAALPLTIPTYDGSDQLVHPDIYYNASGWNGYKYWMAMTPYPNSDEFYENPSVVVSNDGDTWIVPAGLTNPIVASPVGVSDFNSDCDIFMGYDEKLWIIYRSSFPASTTTNVYAISSSDGITWNTPVQILTNATSPVTNISPAVIKENNEYVMYTVDWSVGNGQITRITSATPDGTWSASVNCTITGLPVGHYPWHFDVVKYGNEYHMLLCTSTGGNGSGARLNFAISTDGIAWTGKATPIIDVSVSGWDDILVYRGTMVLMGTAPYYYYDMWYSGAGTPAIWRVGRTVVNIMFVPTPTVASFTHVSNGLTTDFTNTSVGDNLTYSWDFGDGSELNTETNPSHTYATADTYTVVLTATGDVGIDDDSQNVTVSDSTLKVDLVSVWELNETVGTEAVDAHGSNNGVNADITLSQPTATNLGTSYGFNGNTGLVVIPNDVSLHFGTDDIGISIWFNGNDLGNGLQTLFANYHDIIPGADTGIIVRTQGSKIRTLAGADIASAGSRTYRDSGTVLSDNTLYHLVVNWTNATGGLEFIINGAYDNGAYGEQTAGGDDISNLLSPSGIGGLPVAEVSYFNGEIDQPAIRRKIYTLAEAQDIHNSGNGLAYTNW